MSTAATAVPRSTRLTSLRSRAADVAADVRRREATV
jgi:hypothetical protein